MAACWRKASAVAGGTTSPGGTPLATSSNVDFAVLAGDANRDRTVDFDDLLILSQNYTQTGKTFSQGNFDYSADGLVGFDDLLILAQRYGTSLATAQTLKPALAGKKRGLSDVIR